MAGGCLWGKKSRADGRKYWFEGIITVNAGMHQLFYCFCLLVLWVHFYMFSSSLFHNWILTFDHCWFHNAIVLRNWGNEFFYVQIVTLPLNLVIYLLSPMVQIQHLELRMEMLLMMNDIIPLKENKINMLSHYLQDMCIKLVVF